MKKSFMPALALSFLAAFLLIWALSAQYHKIASENKEDIETIEQTMEKIAAKETLNKFMDARLDRQEEQAKIYFTENTMEQYLDGRFILTNDFKSFEILSDEKIEDKKFRFSVDIKENDGINNTIEVIDIIKILDQYFIDSVQLAG